MKVKHGETYYFSTLHRDIVKGVWDSKKKKLIVRSTLKDGTPTSLPIEHGVPKRNLHETHYRAYKRGWIDPRASELGYRIRRSPGKLIPAGEDEYLLGNTPGGPTDEELVEAGMDEKLWASREFYTEHLDWDDYETDMLLGTERDTLANKKQGKMLSMYETDEIDWDWLQRDSKHRAEALMSEGKMTLVQKHDWEKKRKKLPPKEKRWDYRGGADWDKKTPEQEQKIQDELKRINKNYLSDTKLIARSEEKYNEYFPNDPFREQRTVIRNQRVIETPEELMKKQKEEEAMKIKMIQKSYGGATKKISAHQLLFG